MPTAILKDPNAVDGIIKSTEIVQTSRFIHIYGVSGAGKTRLAAQFPKPFFFDFDNGLLSAKDFNWDAKCYFAPTESGRATMWDTFAKDWKKLLKTDSYQTFVFDSVTTMGDACLAWVQALKGRADSQATLPEWGQAIGLLADLHYDLRAYGKDIISISVEELVKDEITGKIRERPMVLGQKLSQRMPLWYDEFWRIAVVSDSKEDQRTRLLHTAPGDSFYAKSRSNLPNIKNPTYDKIKEYFK